MGCWLLGGAMVPPVKVGVDGSVGFPGFKKVFLVFVFSLVLILFFHCFSL